MKDITKEEFIKYETLRKIDGVDMTNYEEASKRCGLEKRKFIYILKNYEELRTRYGKC